MPSLNLRNPFRRNAARQSLRQRAAALKAAAARVIRSPEQSPGPAASAPLDPHIAHLPALRQAFAWVRDVYPIDDRAMPGTPEGNACRAVFRHYWSLADSILALPAPKTPEGLGAVALALSAWFEGSIGRDPDECPEECRAASAIRAMMSIAGANHFPEWFGFGDEPDSEARWNAMLDRAGEGSLPAWALAGKSGPDGASEA